MIGGFFSTNASHGNTHEPIVDIIVRQIIYNYTICTIVQLANLPLMKCVLSRQSLRYLMLSWHLQPPG
jgi:hypothetical protein